MKTIVSRQNPMLKAVRRLAERKGRGRTGTFLVEGRKLIDEARLAGFDIETLFVNAGALVHGDAALEAFAAELEAELGFGDVISLEECLYAELAATCSPQPLLAIVRRRTEALGSDAVMPENGNVLVLDQVSDPGNAGTMIRTALAAGLGGAWCVKGTVDVFSDKALRASAGAVFHLPVWDGLSPDACVRAVRESGRRLVVLAAGGENLYEAELAGELAFVVGNESGGVDAAFMEAADVICGIPMAARSESLNAAAAVAVTLYEKVRRDFEDTKKNEKENGI